jgi:hypothetical protein
MEIRLTIIRGIGFISGWKSWIKTPFSTPLPVSTTDALDGKNIVQIAAAETMTLFLSSDGSLAASGSYGTTDPVYKPTAIPTAVLINGTDLANKTITTISARSTHALILTDSGLVYAFGSNSDGQLGVNITDTFIPTLVPGLEGLRVRDIFAGFSTSFVITTNGTLYAWGAGTVINSPKASFLLANVSSTPIPTALFPMLNVSQVHSSLDLTLINVEPCVGDVSGIVCEAPPNVTTTIAPKNYTKAPSTTKSPKNMTTTSIPTTSVPTATPTPVPLEPIEIELTAPSTIGPCADSFVLDASMTRSPTSDILTYSWSSSSSSLNGFLSTQTDAYITVPTSLVQINVPTTVSLRVSTSDRYSVQNTTFTRGNAANTPPTLRLVGDKDVQWSPGQKEVSWAVVGSICNNEKLSYSWMKVGGPVLRIGSSSASASYTRSAWQFSIAGLYIFKCTVSTPSGLSSSLLVSVNYDYDAVVARLAEGSQITVSNTPNALSLDSTVSTGDCCHGLPETYIWTCTGMTSSCPTQVVDYLAKASGTAGSTSPSGFGTISLPTALPVGQYLFSMTYVEGKKSDTATILVTVIPKNVLKIWISGIKPFSAESTTLQFTAGVSLVNNPNTDDSVTYTYKFSTSGPSGNYTFKYQDMTATELLTIPSSAVSEQGLHTIHINVVDSLGTSGDISIDTVIVTPPQPGSLTINPSVGRAANTTFTIVAPGWQSNSNQLYYMFYFVDGTQLVPLRSGWGLSPSHTTILPIGKLDANQLRIFVVVKDQWGFVGAAFTSVVVLPIADNVMTATNVITDFLNSQYAGPETRNALIATSSSILPVPSTKDATLCYMKGVHTTVNYCQCDKDWFGRYCSLNQQEYTAVLNVKTLMMQTLSKFIVATPTSGRRIISDNVFANSPFSQAEVEQYLMILSSIVDSAVGVSATTATQALLTTNTLLNYGVTSPTISNYAAKVADNVMYAEFVLYNVPRTSDISNAIKGTIISSLLRASLSTMYINQNPATVQYDTFGYTTQVLKVSTLEKGVLYTTLDTEVTIKKSGQPLQLGSLSIDSVVNVRIAVFKYDIYTNTNASSIVSVGIVKQDNTFIDVDMKNRLEIGFIGDYSWITYSTWQIETSELMCMRWNATWLPTTCTVRVSANLATCTCSNTGDYTIRRVDSVYRQQEDDSIYGLIIGAVLGVIATVIFVVLSVVIIYLIYRRSVKYSSLITEVEVTATDDLSECDTRSDTDAMNNSFGKLKRPRSTTRLMRFHELDLPTSIVNQGHADFTHSPVRERSDSVFTLRERSDSAFTLRERSDSSFSLEVESPVPGYITSPRALGSNTPPHGSPRANKYVVNIGRDEMIGGFVSTEEEEQPIFQHRRGSLTGSPRTLTSRGSFSYSSRSPTQVSPIEIGTPKSPRFVILTPKTISRSSSQKAITPIRVVDLKFEDKEEDSN